MQQIIAAQKTKLELHQIISRQSSGCQTLKFVGQLSNILLMIANANTT